MSDIWDKGVADSNAVLGGKMRVMSVVTTHDEHPGVMVLVSDTESGQCLSVVMDGAEAIRIGSAILEGGNYTRQREIDREREED